MTAGATSTGKEKRWTVRKLFVLQRALMDPALSKADVLVLAAIVEYLNGIHGVAWPSVETIAFVTGLPRRTVQRSLRRLERRDCITVERGGGKGHSNRYSVKLDFPVSPFQDAIKRAAARAAEQRAAPVSPFTDSKGDNQDAKGRQSVHQTATATSPEPTERTLLKSPSSNEASACADALLQDDQKLGKNLARIERALRQRPEEFDLYEVRSFLEHLHINLDRLDANYGRAYRLLDVVAVLIEDLELGRVDDDF